MQGEQFWLLLFDSRPKVGSHDILQLSGYSKRETENISAIMEENGQKTDSTWSGL